MKLFSLLALSLFVTPAFAGTAVSYNNDALGFTIVASAMDDNVTVCNEKNKCLEFEPIKLESQNDYELCDAANNCKKYKEKPDNVANHYKEKHGKCVMEMEPKNVELGGFMFDLSLQIVRVTRGTKNCVLPNEFGKRELWGTYQ